MRAIAVTVVVLNHADFDFMPGGYIGVDLFFVISGFLITSLLMRDFKNSGLDLAGFYERRCRRILPPLTAMAVVVTVWAWFYLQPQDFHSYGRTLAAMALFGSNVYFYFNTGYWDPSADSTLFLHTWSLAVEEQFYVVFPLLLWFLHQKFPRRLPLLLAGLGLCALAASQHMLYRDPKAAFYMLQFRAWELLLGAAVALAPPFRLYSSRPIMFLLGTLGLAGMVWPAFTYTSETPFPGLAALPACLGAALLIHIHSSGFGASWVGCWLASSPMVGLGKISYSLYLWHWPILIGRNLLRPRPAELGETLLLITLAVGISILSYVLLEQPVRKKKILALPRSVFQASAAAVIVLAAMGLSINATRGFNYRLPVEYRLPDPGLERYDFGERSEDGRIIPYNIGGRREPLFLIWGDSHAAVWVPALIELSREFGINGLAITSKGCQPGHWNEAGNDLKETIPLQWADLIKTCRDTNTQVEEMIKAKNIKHVIVSGRFSYHFGDYRLTSPFTREYSKLLKKNFLQMVENMSQAGITVWMAPPMIEQRDVAVLAAKAAAEGSPLKEVGLDIKESTALLAPVEAMYRTAEGLGARQLFFQPSMCPAGQCRIGDDWGLFYRDDNHLSVYGALHFRYTFAPLFEHMRDSQ